MRGCLPLLPHHLFLALFLALVLLILLPCLCLWKGLAWSPPTP